MKSRRFLFILISGVIIIILLAGIIYFHGLNSGKIPDVKETSSDGTEEEISDPGAADSQNDTESSAVTQIPDTAGTAGEEGTVAADMDQAGGEPSVTEAAADSGSKNTPAGDNTDLTKDNAAVPSDQPQGSDDDSTDTQGVTDTITISAVGDLTLGRDINFSYEGSFDQEFELQNEDYDYFLRNVKDIFKADDLTVGNLETTLTTATKMAEKKFRFKGDPSYTEILKRGGVEVVSIANNHTYDYFEKGYKDTLANLNSAGIGYFGNDDTYITQIRGIKIGFLGYTYWEDSDALKKKVKDAIAKLRGGGADIVIIMYHWGIERDYIPYDVQIDMGHFTIDSGADLVLGSHPHVLQGIEEYKGKDIVYSLGNFCYGGNKNPEDKDTMIVVHKFNFENGKLVSEENKVVPCSISSVMERNNFQPTPLNGEKKDRVLKKIEKNSQF
jgi:poly-gamma-glutamate synthesis protein (capsule biosynthesis protein)